MQLYVEYLPLQRRLTHLNLFAPDTKVSETVKEKSKIKNMEEITFIVRQEEIGNTQVFEKEVGVRYSHGYSNQSLEKKETRTVYVGH